MAAISEPKMVVNAKFGPADTRYTFARELYLRAGYDEADAAEFEEIHCLKDRHPWMGNGFCQTFSIVESQKCRCMVFFPGQELQPHKHDRDEDFVITLGAVDLWIWPDGPARPLTALRYAAGDRFGVQGGLIHCLRADRVQGLAFHEVCGSETFGKRSTAFAQISDDSVLRNLKIPSAFVGKTVLITGANRGIGLGFARHFTEAGAKVLAACRDPSKATELQALSPVPTLLVLDIASEEKVDALSKQLEDAGVNSLDYLINNAGISVPKHPNDPIVSTTPALMREVMNVNVVGTVYLTQVLLPYLEKGLTKTVVNLSSQLASIANCWGVQGRAGGVACYRMSRAANNMAVRCFGGELMDQGYVFIGMSPGHVATDMGSAGGRTAPLTVDQSVSGMLSVIGRTGPRDNGKFLQYDGSELPW